MRILMITQWFEPEPTFKGLLFAHALQRLGHEVEVLTGFPNYPGGKLYPGYRMRPYRRETIEGVRVMRVALYPSHGSSGVGRALNYLSFAASATVVAPFLRRPDVVYVYHPPAPAALPAMMLKFLRGVPYVVDIQDLWPDTLAATGMLQGTLLLRGIGRAMTMIYRHAHAVVVLSDGFRERLIENLVPARKVHVIRNWTSEEPVWTDSQSTSLRAELNLLRSFVVVFAGTMGKAQSLRSVLEGASILKGYPDVTLLFIGSGVDRQDLEVAREGLGLTNVLFLPRRPTSAIGEVLAMADALLVHLKDDPLFTVTIPSKTQACLRAGRPILMGVRGESAKLVEDARAGTAFEPDNPKALADAVLGMRALGAAQRAAMGMNGRAYYAEQLALDVGVHKFERVFRHAARSTHKYARVKRLMDIVGAGTVLVLAAIPMAIIAIVIRFRMGAPIIFQQLRPGQSGDPFTLLKFRTMTDYVEPNPPFLPDAERLTGLGRILRATSLDELPELINVLRGEMSLVGPRPLLMRYTPYFTKEERRRFDVKPGITGLAQVRGRNLASWDKRLALDVRYVENLNPLLDLRLLISTLGVVLKRQGVVIDPESTMSNLDDERRRRFPFADPVY